MASLHYLTVQDVLWINLQVTKRVQHFIYAKLEEACFYQYAYGASHTLEPQAARFLTGFMKLRPFAAGNEATALAGFLAFLEINGRPVSLPAAELDAWIAKVKEGQGETPFASLGKAEAAGHGPLVPDVRTTVWRILARYPQIVESDGEAVSRSA